MTRVAPSAELEAQIEELLGALETFDSGTLAELGRLGARLVMQRALEEEVAAFPGRARYERTPQARGQRNGVRPKRVQTAEGELEVQVPRVRNTAEAFVSKTIPDTRTAVRTRPLEALVIGGYVRGLSDRDIGSVASAQPAALADGGGWIGPDGGPVADRTSPRRTRRPKRGRDGRPGERPAGAGGVLGGGDAAPVRVETAAGGRQLGAPPAARQ